MYLRGLLSLLMVLGGFIPVPEAYGQIVVNGVLRTMTVDQRPIENVEVSNASENRILQVNISIKESFINEGKQETFKSVDDFLIAPKNMILRPGEKKQARLVLRKPPGDVERYYRVSFQAQIPDPIRMKALQLTEAEQASQDVINGSVVMVSGVGMFMTVSPKNPKPKLTWSRDNTGITFKNEGNTSVDMRLRRSFCFDGKDDCIVLPSQRIYPGHSWRFEIAGHKPLVYYYNIYKKTNKAIIGAVK